MAGLGAGRREGRLSAGPSAYLSAEWGEALLGGTESCRGEVARERENPGVWEAEGAVTHLVGLERSRGENLTDRAGSLSAPPMSEHLLSDKNRPGDNCSRWRGTHSRILCDAFSC